MFEAGHLVERIDHNTSIGYQIFKRIWPLSKRDFLNLTTVCVLPNKSLVLGGTAIQHDAMPPTKGNVRAEVKTAGWLLEPKGPNLTLVHTVIQVDLGGSIPQR